jgi:nitrogen fixation protein FixH
MSDAKPLTGRTVLFCFIGFFGVIAGMNAILVRAATSTFGGVETASAYKASVTFKNELAAARAQAARGWSVTANLQRDATGAAGLDLRIADADGRAPSGLTATARLTHPTDSRRDRVIELVAGIPGAFQGAAEAEAGQWDLVIDLHQGEERAFRSRNRITLPRGH